ncbi:MAG: xanthine dehydrogenase accessory protein XdhC [Rhodoferax sp.]|nr:xanthine dehydrogenase accessory protein XdhC [Rhodoferax sp.]
MNQLSHLLDQLARARGVLVSVQATRGSVPREAGSWMAVFAHTVLGSIGGGRLERDATLHARQLLAQSALAAATAPGAAAALAGQVQQQHYRLGPSLGQCCGGEVQLQYEVLQVLDALGPADVQALRQRLASAHTPLALFGGGHVGRALVQVFVNLPWNLAWIDSRDEIFPSSVPPNVRCEHSDPVQAAVPTLVPGSQVLIMSFSHAEDLDILAACLSRQREQADLPFIGLIGSKTKWASFRSRLRERGFTDAELNRVTSPIGIPGLRDKRPEAIAISVAAQLLLLQQAG